MGDKQHHTLYNAALILFLLAYLALGAFSLYWLAVLTPRHPIGSDFRIYYQAYMDAQAGDNPYLPYDIGTSYVYHPFALTFLSLFSPGDNNQVTALRFWITAGVVAWIGVVWLVVRLLRSDFWGKDTPFVADSRMLGGCVLLFLGFGPLWETLHTGQINTFVVVFLYLSFYLAEKRHEEAAGLFLALAIVLKTSPLIFIAYFFVFRRYRVVFSTLISLGLLTLVPLVQFLPRVIWDFVHILPLMGTAIHATPYNQSVLSLVFRLVKSLGYADWGPTLIWGHKVIFAGLLALLFGGGWLARGETKALRFWVFTTLVALMVFFSPLVWYHHSVFLLLPLAALLLHRSRVYGVVGLSLLSLIQLDRVFEHFVMRAGVPVLLAQGVLIGVLLGMSFAEWRGLNDVRRA
ncbi:MAG: glycosyltransferase family 87 protein [Anaerolineae bacterium]|jgi:hypothetical protein|nr:glycosyltransferase family 87 protein [Anaerolineae bacterium]